MKISEASPWIQSNLEFLRLEQTSFHSSSPSCSSSNFSIFLPEESKPPSEEQLVIIRNGLNHEILQDG
uniref:Uncharacterized protein n=1 Tax=Kalanchoe fedtschenkoi TaxID=63787 RepID=A0A7N0U1W6_KALFE